MDPEVTHRDHAYVPRFRSIEDRRMRGEVACAECRRLKLKCDRNVPCSSCTKRGCEELCPNGSNVTKDTTRVVFAATQHLHDAHASLRTHLRKLEGALDTLHRKRAGYAHPLLGEGDDGSSDDEPRSTDVDEVDASIDSLAGAVGVLTLAEDGSTHFFGDGPPPSGSSVATSGHGNLADLPEIVKRCERLFPFPTPPDTCAILVPVLQSYLPPRAAAEKFCKLAAEHYIPLLPAISRGMVFDELIPSLYCPASYPTTSDPLDREPANSPRSFALFFALCAHGSLLEVENPDRVSHAASYARLCVAGLGARCVMESPSFVSVAALFYYANYLVVCQKDIGDKGRSCFELAFQLGVQLGLHRDPRHYNLPWKATQRRRAMFWVLFAANVWECLSTGRPPVICQTLYIDCEYAFDENTEHDEGGPKLRPEAYGHQRLRDTVLRMIAILNVVQVPPYEEVLQLDAQVRREFARRRPALLPPGLLAQAMVAGPYNEMLLMMLHRGYCMRALKESPEDPSASPYMGSVLITVRCARAILEWLPIFFNADRNRSLWILPQAWSWAMNAAVVISTVIQHAPSSNCVEFAMGLLDQIYGVFEDTKNHGGGRAAYGLPILHDLCAKARGAIASRNFVGSSSRSLYIPLDVPESASSPPVATPTGSSPLSETGSASRSAAPRPRVVSKSFESLFAQFYHQPTTPPPPRPAQTRAYPGYLQPPLARSAKPKRASEKAPATIRLPALHPDVLLAGQTRAGADPAGVPNASSSGTPPDHRRPVLRNSGSGGDRRGGAQRRSPSSHPSDYSGQR